MPEELSEEKSLLDELKQSDLFKNPNGDEENPLIAGGDEKKEEVPVVGIDESKLTKRMERRQAEKIRQLREENIALAERLKIIAEQKSQNTEESDYLKKVERIYGTVDEKGQYDPQRAQATELLKSALADAVEDARRKALEEFESRQQAVSTEENEALRENKSFLEDALADVEEAYGIDMESSKERNAYLDLLERMSPKDEDGDIKEYADPDAVAEMYLKVRSSSTSQAKQIASRSMSRGGASGQSTVQEDATLRWLKENDLI